MQLLNSVCMLWSLPDYWLRTTTGQYVHMTVSSRQRIYVRGWRATIGQYVYACGSYVLHNTVEGEACSYMCCTMSRLFFGVSYMLPVHIAAEFKLMERVSKYKDIAAQGEGKFKDYISKRRKKNAAKDHRFVPYERR